MRIFAILLACSVILLSSCQKEVSYSSTSGNNNGGGNNNGTLLTKFVEKSPTDSLVNVLTYDASKRIIKISRSGVTQGTSVNTEYRYWRNANGIVMYYSTADPALVVYGIDSFVTKVNYDAAHSRYAGYVLNLNVQGFIISDSSVFVYDNSGNMIEDDVWESPTGDGTNYFYTGKFVYSYSNGNMTQFDIHDYDQSGAETFTATTKYTYDANPNALFVGNETFVIGHGEWLSLNNILGQQLSDSGGPSDDQTVSYVYTYGNDKKPLTATITLMPGNTVSTITYYYQ